MAQQGRSRRWLRRVAAGVALLTVGAAGAWALLTILRPAEDPLASTEHTYVKVAAGSVGASISLNTVAEWTQIPVAANQATGIVTGQFIEAGEMVSQGSILYTVGLRPVVAAQGDVPMFRDIKEGAVGEDVRQLQKMLSVLGHYRGVIDGRCGQGTTAAIKSWQGALGLQRTGLVALGDVVFLPHVPTRVALDAESIRRGVTLVGGEEGVLGLTSTPRFWIPVTESQAAMIPSGGVVEITSPEGETWYGSAGEQERSPEDGTITVAVTGIGDGSVCGNGCATVPVAGQTTLKSRIVTVEQVEGLVVPSAALVTTADGVTAVIDTDDRTVPVTIVTSAKGMSVITGAEEGLRVRIPAERKSGG